MVASQLALASWVASTWRHHLLLEPAGKPKWAWLLFATPFSLNTPLLCVFLLISFQNVVELYGLCNDTCFPSGMLRNFMDYATMLVFLLECGETLRIMQRCSFRGFRREQTRFKDRPQVLPDETRVWHSVSIITNFPITESERMKIKLYFTLEWNKIWGMIN